MLRIASVVAAVALLATSAFGANLTGQFKATVTGGQDDGTACFEQVPGTCDGGTFISAIVSQLNLTGTNCGTYGPPPPMSRTADEFMCPAGSQINGATWLGTYFGDVVTCPPLGAAATFNIILHLGGTPCPDPVLEICNLVGMSPTITDLGDNDWAYALKFECPLGIPDGAPVYFTPQINEDAFPQWGWTESAQGLVGGDPCLIAPGFGITTWIPVPDAVGELWCGQAFTIQAGTSTPVDEASWGAVKATFSN